MCWVGAGISPREWAILGGHLPLQSIVSYMGYLNLSRSVGGSSNATFRCYYCSDLFLRVFVNCSAVWTNRPRSKEFENEH